MPATAAMRGPGSDAWPRQAARVAAAAAGENMRLASEPRACLTPQHRRFRQPQRLLLPTCGWAFM